MSVISVMSRDKRQALSYCSHSESSEFQHFVDLQLNRPQMFSQVAARHPLGLLLLIGLADKAVYFGLQLRSQNLSCGFSPFRSLQVCLQLVHPSKLGLQNSQSFEESGCMSLLYFLDVSADEYFLLFEGVVEDGNDALVGEVELGGDPGFELVVESVQFLAEFCEADRDFIGDVIEAAERLHVGCFEAAGTALVGGAELRRFERHLVRHLLAVVQRIELAALEAIQLAVLQRARGSVLQRTRRSVLQAIMVADADILRPAPSSVGPLVLLQPLLFAAGLLWPLLFAVGLLWPVLFAVGLLQTVNSLLVPHQAVLQGVRPFLRLVAMLQWSYLVIIG